jgi:hypothetical protein
MTDLISKNLNLTTKYIDITKMNAIANIGNQIIYISTAFCAFNFPFLNFPKSLYLNEKSPVINGINLDESNNFTILDSIYAWLGECTGDTRD